MKWIRRALLILAAIPLLAAGALLVAGRRADAGHTQAQVEILRPPAEVFPHIVDPGLLQRWAGLSELELVGGPPVRVGSRARAVIVARGRRTELESEVTAMQRDRLLAYLLRTTGDAPVYLTQLSRYVLEEREGRTLVIVTTDTSYQGVVPGLLEPLLTRAAERLLQAQLYRLKAQVEAAETAPAEADSPIVP